MTYLIKVWQNNKWNDAKEGNFSKSAAGGLFNQFRQQYTTRVWKGNKQVAAFTHDKDKDEMIDAGYIPCEDFDNLNE